MSDILFEVYILIGSLVWNLRGTSLACYRVSSDSSAFGKTISDTIYEHSGDRLGGFFLITRLTGVGTVAILLPFG